MDKPLLRGFLFLPASDSDVSHYFDSDPTNLVSQLRGDGKKPSAYIADTTTANAQVRSPP